MQLGRVAGHRFVAGVVLSVFISTGGTARASEASSVQSRSVPTAEQLAAARDFFERGKTLFTQGKYDAAWIKFSSAYQIVELPDLLFNMARTEERMGRHADAAKHYREFLTKSPDDPDAIKIRGNIARLEKQAALLPPTMPVNEDRPRRVPIYSAIAGGGTLLFTIIGAAALGTANAKYNGLASTCAPACSMTDALSLKPTYQTGQAFLTLAAIGAAGTVGLLVWELRRGRRERSLVVLPDTLPQTAYGSY